MPLCAYRDCRSEDPLHGRLLAGGRPASHVRRDTFSQVRRVNPGVLVALWGRAESSVLWLEGVGGGAQACGSGSGLWKGREGLSPLVRGEGVNSLGEGGKGFSPVVGRGGGGLSPVVQF